MASILEIIGKGGSTTTRTKSPTLTTTSYTL